MSKEFEISKEFESNMWAVLSASLGACASLEGNTLRSLAVAVAILTALASIRAWTKRSNPTK